MFQRSYYRKRTYIIRFIVRVGELPKLGQDHDHVLEEVKKNTGSVPSVAFSSIDIHESFKMPELSNGIVTSSSSLLTFLALNTDTNMRSCDHINIICSITNSQSYGFWFLD